MGADEPAEDEPDELVPVDPLVVDELCAVPVVVLAEAVSVTPPITIAVSAAPTATTTPLASWARRRRFLAR